MKAKALQFGKAMSAALFVLLLCAVGMTKGYSYSFSAVCPTGQTLYYNITDETNHYVEITYPGTSTSNPWSGYTKPRENIVFPESVEHNGIPFSVTSIGQYAFQGCSSLTSVEIPNSVTSIGERAFNCCYSASFFTIPSSVVRIGREAFMDTSWYYCEPNGILYKDNCCLGFKGNRPTGGLSIDEGTRVISDYAFSQCSDLTFLLLPNSLLTIGAWAFSDCNSLSGELIIPDSVISICDAAFIDCYHITSLVLGNSLQTIGYSAFDACGSITELVIPNSVISIDGLAFNCCYSLTGTIVIPSSVSSLGNYPGNEIRSIFGWDNIEQIIVATDNPAYDSRGNCNAIINSITNELITGCKNSYISTSVTSIGAGAFFGSSLTSIEIPNSVTSIGKNSFARCTGLTSVTIPSGVTSIGASAFSNCSGLISINIPSGVTSIGEGVFSNCSSLTTIAIPSGVTSIGEYAFASCTRFRSITLDPITPPILASNAFFNFPKNIPVYVLCNCKTAYQNANYWSEFTNYIEICPYTVFVSANPIEGGTIIGAGEFGEGSICTLTATPNEGYTFINWTKDGEEVSTEATYSFTVTEDAEFVANFNPIAFHFTTSGLWSESSNWQSGSLPGFDNEVFIEADCQLDQNTTVNSLTVSNGQSLALQPNKTLTVTGDLTNTSTEGLVIKDGAQLINASGNVAATMEKDIVAYSNNNPDAWYTIASPMNGMAIEGSGYVTPEYDLYRYNETNLNGEEWENYKANLADFTTFEKGRGYLFANSNSFSPVFIGTLNNTDVICSLTCTNRPNDPLSGFNLIGNPFPHDIYKGAGAAINDANLASGYYTLTNEGTWQVHTFEDAIHPGQGILVKATAPTILTIAKSTAVATAETGGAKRGTSPLSISVKGENGMDQAFVYFGPGNSMEKMASFVAQEPSLWVRDNGKDYAIVHVEKACETLELFFSCQQTGDFTLTVDGNETIFEYLQLVDHVTGLTVDLLKQPTYGFHATGQEPDARFSIRFKVVE